MNAATFPARLRALRTRAGYSQAELATKTGLERKSIIRYENGQGSPNTRALQALASVFGISTSELLGEADGDLKQALIWLGAAMLLLETKGVEPEWRWDAWALIDATRHKQN